MLQFILFSEPTVNNQLGSVIQSEGIKMKYSRSVLICTLVVASVFLAGFKKPIPDHGPSIKDQHIPGENNLKPKPLDLTVPSNDVSFQNPPYTLTLGQDKPKDGLTEDNKNKTRSLELQGRLIMSPEPEVEKTKSTDGAGIIINLHH